MTTSINHAHTLSKSNFKIAQSCPAKLYYKKNGYPSADYGNEYMEYLAEGGYVVGVMAKMYYPNGVEIDTSRGMDIAAQQTADLLLLDNVVLFEAVLYSNNKLVAIDILEKVGNHFNIIEVKSKGVDETLKLDKAWQEHLEDITYQKLTLKECYPDSIIDSYLFVPNKSATTDIDNLYSQFKMIDKSNEHGFQSFEIQFDGDKEEIVKDNLLIKVNVNPQVEALEEVVKKSADNHIAQLKSGEKPIVQITKDCFSCEYTTQKGDALSGFDECWSHIDKPQHHIRDLYQLGRVKRGTENLANSLIEENRVSLSDIPLVCLTMSYKTRQKIQIANTLADTEWYSEYLDANMELAPYPHHFIDFETITTALPFHKGLCPYEMVAFQWSCHTVESKGADPVHSEWLNTDPTYPSFRFAESLYKQLGSEGTIFMWATHENTVLRDIYYKMQQKGYDNPELMDWLKDIVKFDKDTPGKLVDMNRMTLEFYFHPKMKGRTSIKYVLPAVLSATKSPNIEKWLKKFTPDLDLLSRDDEDIIENPYKNLPNDNGINVSEGTGAMRGYTELLYGDENRKADYETALFRYCKLDTLAMVIIWEHWETLVKS